MTSAESSAQALCRTCGLCCNGALFKDVELRHDDDPERLQALGLVLKTQRRRRAQSERRNPPGVANPPRALPQPCPALDGSVCRIYLERPAHCRDFECLLLNAVRTGRVASRTAHRIVQTARRRVDRIGKLLRKLGDLDEHVALSLRFRRVSNRRARAFSDHRLVGALSQLTLAVHDLNLLLRKAFYPG